MAYIKTKWIKGNEYHYLVESYRVGRKVKTRTLRYLGKQKPEGNEAHAMGARHKKPGSQLTLSLSSSAGGESRRYVGNLSMPTQESQALHPL